MSSKSLQLSNASLIKACELDPNERYYKLTNENECHNGMRYKTGLNTDFLPFNPTGSCKAGGLYFFSESQLLTYQNYIDFQLCWIREVTFGNIEDTIVYCEKNKFKTHQFMLGERQQVQTRQNVMDHIRFDNAYVAKITVTDHGDVLCHVPDEHKTYELCLIAVSQCCNALQCVPEKHKTYELCLIAVTNNGTALRYVPEIHRTPELCLAAITKNGTRKIQNILHMFSRHVK